MTVHINKAGEHLHVYGRALAIKQNKDAGIVTRRAMLARLDRTGQASIVEMAEAAGVTHKGAHHHIKRLVDHGHIAIAVPANCAAGRPALYVRTQAMQVAA